MKTVAIHIGRCRVCPSRNGIGCEANAKSIIDNARIGCPVGRFDELPPSQAIKTPIIDLPQRQAMCQSCPSLIEFEDSVELDERGSLTVRCEKKRCPRKRVILLTERCPAGKW